MIYLDHAATTPLDPRVLEAMMPYLTTEYGNPGSLYACGRAAKKAVEKAREQVAAFFNCDPGQVIFTSGGSEGNNTVFNGVVPWMKAMQKSAVLISAIEHDSVRRAAQHMCIKHGFDLQICPPNTDGEVKMSAIREQITPETGLVSVMLANNETGVVNDLHAIASVAHHANILIHTDAVQAAGILPLDTKGWDNVDFMTVSSHKINGPKGVGALFIRNPGDLFDPLVCGGRDQEFGLRGGTENVAGIVGFGKACELSDQECEKNFRYLQKECSQLTFMLVSLANKHGIDVRFNGDRFNAIPKTLSVCFPGVDAETMLLMLDARDICVSAGSACRSHENTPSHVLKAMGVSDDDARSTIRISLSHTNTPEEVDEAARAIVDVAATLRSM